VRILPLEETLLPEGEKRRVGKLPCICGWHLLNLNLILNLNLNLNLNINLLLLYHAH
jgi:hypothetical protein